MKEFIKKFIPDFTLIAYHLTLSWLGAFIYGNPSQKLIVVGVTGTNGKSTVVNLIAKILEEAGYKVGLTSTFNFRIAGQEQYNKTKLTMPGRFFLQKKLAEMVKLGCKYAVLEVSSEGLVQYRHQHIYFDAAVFTNLTPEHLERHGGFEKYKKAKLMLFEHLAETPHKVLDGKIVEKTIVVNGEDEYAKDFLDFQVDNKIIFGLSNKSRFDLSLTLLVSPSRERSGPTPGEGKVLIADSFQTGVEGSKFEFLNSRPHRLSSALAGAAKFKINLLGRANISNCLAAIAVTNTYGVGLEVSAKALEKIKIIPGRMEWIDEGQSFRVMVDYAPEPYSLKFLYETVKMFEKNKLIHVLGSTGGGRDKARRQVLGKMAGQTADIVIVTNEDPYDEEPMEIINSIAKGAESAGKIKDKNLFCILDRREAIKKALNLSEESDLVLITGKGSEQVMVVANGKKIPWDDRVVTREEIGKILN